jgi:fermentation-respiration switch protein FrsA (DUF1100 family)
MLLKTIGRVPAGIALAVVLLIAGCLLLWFKILPDYFFGYIIKRKAPMPGSPAYEQAEAVRAASPAWIDTLPHELISVRSHDGLTLQGWFFAPRGNNSGDPLGNTTVIMAHGYAGDPRQLGNIVQGMYNLGYNLLLPSARGCGDSQGDYIGFGLFDRLDYLRWIDWVKERTAPYGPVNIILYGISMGGATVLMTGGENPPPEVKVIINDCGYTSLYDELLHQMKMRYHFQNEGFLKLVSRVSGKRAGYSFEEVSVLDQVKKIRIPVFFIHGDADTFVPFEMGRILYEACPAPKEFYIVKGAGHGEAHGNNPEEYYRRITQFLRKYNL